ncbi:hypothetical protein BH10BAC2_BH10BAC2_28630 [soil metagenome]
MKNQLICLCAFILAFMAVPAIAQVDNLSKTNYGIWQSFGDPVSSYVNPEVRGRLCNFNWSNLEPAPNKWYWKSFDSSLAARAIDGLPIIFMVYTEESAPEWIYSNGVPKVAQKDNKGNFLGYAPFYTDADYKIYFKRMITEVRKHVETLPPAVRNQVIAVQACLGSTGDYISYKGDVDPQYRISTGNFYSLFQEFTQYYYDEYKNTNPKIALLSNPKNNGPDQAQWLFANCPGGWIKTGSIGKGYQLNEETVKAGWLYPLINTPIYLGEYVRARSEIIGGTTSAGWWNRAAAKNMYALMCYDIYWGLDWSNQGYDQINDKIYDSAFGFYNKYAGEKDPAKSAYAMCALRDGLDANDSIRFPAASYGKVDRANALRFINIANAYGANGAMLEDVNNAMADELNNLAARGTNDVGWKIFPGNYERFLHQIKANQTSVGFWNVESANKNDMYGKYARGFDLAKGKDALYFDVEDAFFNNTPLNSKKPFIVDIIYLDNSYGSWQLFYDGADDADKPSIQVKGTNSKLWKRASITIHDGYLGNRGNNGADFYIKSTGTENVIFSTVELRRPYDGELTGLSASKIPAFSTVCSGAGSSFQTLYVSGSFLPGGNVTVGPLKGFGFSVDSGKTYPDSVILKDVGAAFSKKIFVKFKPDAQGIYNGNIPLRGDNVPPVYISVEATSVNSSPSLQPFVKSLSCNGAKDGAIDLVCTGGAGPFTYNWAGPDYLWLTTEDISSLAAGTYTVSVKSQGGCITKTTLQITEPSALQVNTSALPIPANETTTNVTVAASGGTAPYLGTGNFTVGAGTYTYTVTDANGCNTNAVVNVTAESQTSLAALASTQGIICHGGFATVTITAAGGTAPYTGTGNFIEPAGTYTYTVTDAIGATSTVTVTVNDPSAFNIDVTAGNVLCNGGYANIAVSATGGIAPYSGTGNFSVSAGIYTYTVTDSNGCPSVKTINIKEPAKLIANSSAAPVLCNGDGTSVTVSVTGGTAPYTGTGNFMAKAGSYNYTVTDANGCQATSPLTIAEPLLLSIEAQAPPIAVNQTTTAVTLTATGGTAPYTGTGNFTVAEGVYNYIVTDANGCQAGTSVSVTSTQIPALTATATKGTILCNGGSTTITINANGGVAPYSGTGTYTVSAGSYTYTITDAAGQTSTVSVDVTEPEVLMINSISRADASACKGGAGAIIINTTGGTIPYAYTLNTGSYQSSNEFHSLTDGAYTVNVKDQNGCTSSAPAVVTKTAALKAWFSAVTDVSNCGLADGTVTISNEGGLAPFTYSINGGNFQSSNVFSKLPESDFVVTTMDSRGCETSAFTTIKKDDPLTLSITNKLPVSGCSATDGSITVAASGGGGAYQYCLNGQPFKGSNIFSDLSAGDYTLTVKDWRGCTKAVTATIIKLPTLVANIQSIINAGACSSDGSLKVGLSGGSGPYLYSINGGLYQPENTFNNLSAGIYMVQVKDGRGCIAKTVATIAKAPQMTIAAEKTDISCIGGSDGTITITNSNGVAPYEYSIDAKAFGTRNIFGNLKAGTHNVITRDSKGCTVSIPVYIEPGTENCGPVLPSITNNPDSVLIEVIVLPNPSPTEFTLIINSNSDQRAEIVVTDMTGKIVYKASGSALQQYRFGNQFASGMYMVRVMQGLKTKTVKVIKTK